MKYIMTPTSLHYGAVYPVGPVMIYWLGLSVYSLSYRAHLGHCVQWTLSGAESQV